MNRLLILTFWVLVGVFVFLIARIFIPLLGELFEGSLLFLLPFIVFSLLGGVLIFLTLKERVGGKLKKFLLLTGISSAGVFVGIFLHNLIYGLFVYWFGPDFWERIGGDEPFFFFLALVVCPIGFLVGVVGSITLFIRQRKGQ